MAASRGTSPGSGRCVNQSDENCATGYGFGLIPAERSRKGSGAPGNSARAADRSPPCASGATSPGRAMTPALTLLALLIEVMFGYPSSVSRAVGHPAAWMGRLIGMLDRDWNRESLSPTQRRLTGVAALVML